MSLRINSTIRNIKELIKDKNVLDIGATGMAQGNSMSKEIKKLAKTYTSIDKEENVERFDLKETFDVITMFEVLEHLENPGLALEQIKKHCSGTFIMSVPNIKGVYSLIVPQTKYHLSCWDEKTLQQRLWKYFNIVIIKKINFGRTLLAICKDETY